MSSRLELVDLIAAELCIGAVDEVGVVGLLQAELHLEVGEKLPLSVCTSIGTRCVSIHVRRLVPQPVYNGLFLDGSARAMIFEPLFDSGKSTDATILELSLDGISVITFLLASDNFLGCLFEVGSTRGSWSFHVAVSWTIIIGLYWVDAELWASHIILGSFNTWCPDR